MERKTSETDTRGGQVPDWLEELDEEKKEKSIKTSPPSKKEEEEVVPHTPKRKEKPVWKYSLKEGGQIYRINAPTTENMVEKVKKQIDHPRNWRRYARSPHGGDRNYTQLTCFPPFDALRVAELFFPDGTIWNSRQRKYIKANKE